MNKPTTGRHVGEFVIEHGVPLPRPHTANNDPLVAAMLTMSVDDSIFVSCDDKYQTQNAVHKKRVNYCRSAVQYKYKQRAHRAVQVVENEQKGVRVWRVEDGSRRKYGKRMAKMRDTDPKPRRGIAHAPVLPDPALHSSDE